MFETYLPVSIRTLNSFPPSEISVRYWTSPAFDTEVLPMASALRASSWSRGRGLPVARNRTALATSSAKSSKDESANNEGGFMFASERKRDSPSQL